MDAQQKLKLNFPNIIIDDEGTITNSSKIHLTDKRKKELTKEIENLKRKYPEKSLHQSSAQSKKYGDASKFDNFEEGIASIMNISPNTGKHFSKISHHVEDAPKLLAHEHPNKISRKKLLERFKNLTDGNAMPSRTLANLGDYVLNNSKQTKSQILYSKTSNTTQNSNGGRSHSRLMRSIHDKFNTAIRVDQNWGTSSKVATDFTLCKSLF